MMYWKSVELQLFLKRERACVFVDYDRSEVILD